MLKTSESNVYGPGLRQEDQWHPLKHQNLGHFFFLILAWYSQKD